MCSGVVPFTANGAASGTISCTKKEINMHKQRFRLYRRNGTYYSHESDTGKQIRAKDK
jgi:hypothetical protein